MSVGNTGRKRKRGGAGRMAIGLICLVAAVALAFVAVTLQKNHQAAQATAAENDRIMSDTAAIAGVSVGGVNISGMTKEQALAATANVADALLAKVQIAVDIAGELHNFTAQDLGVTTDYAAVVEKALSYGHTGALEDRKKEIEAAKTQGMAFPVSLQADKEKILAALAPIKQQFDKAAVDASYTFTPWGHYADGTAYKQDQQAMIQACASGTQFALPDTLVRISKADMPIALRYQFWKNSKYVDNYIPYQADISRFAYKDGQSGQSVDTEAVAESIMQQLQSGSYSTITAPVTTVAPSVTLADIKKNTQLISSWTSSFSRHFGYNRNWNVAKLSGIICGVVIEPQQEWSINKQAGNRTVSTGWLEAPGISNGGYTQQAGGGVCQISSTVYNASIRSALEITDSTHHTISSDYIPLGLDATISSGAPDLKIKNPYSVPVYIVSYVNPKDRNVTVEIYGPPVTDPQYGDVILDFSFQDGGTFGTPKMFYYYDFAIAPDDTVIAPGDSYEYAKARPGHKVSTFIHTLSLDGKELKVADFHDYTWNPINGKTYVNAPEPSTITTTPPPDTTTGDQSAATDTTKTQ